MRVSKPGTGEVTIRHADTPDYLMDLTYFFSLKERMQILYPLQFTKVVGKNFDTNKFFIKKVEIQWHMKGGLENELTWLLYFICHLDYVI